MDKLRISSKLLESTALFIFLLVSVAPVSQAASDSAYIDALNAEIGGPPPAGKANSSASNAKEENLIGKGRHAVGSELPTGLKQEAFEAELKRSFIGSYVFYNKLSNTDKEAVYNYYKTTANIDDIREKIKALLTK